MKLADVTVRRHDRMQGGYRLLVMDAPAIAPHVRPGQFVHLRVPHLDQAVLRRPFSVFKTEGDELSILYKDVGRGTATMTTLRVGESLSLMGPLGHGYPVETAGKTPVLIAGGYGMAALYMLAQALPDPGHAFFGGATSTDILCVAEFEALGWTVHVTTVDGSLGRKGVVTDALDAWPEPDGEVVLFACGPNAMLRAVGERAGKAGCTAWLSVDRNMGCGIGACLTCVLKVRDGESWKWVRACKEGPVFESSEIIWETVG